MNLSHSDLIFSPNPYDSHELLESWRWLVGQEATLIQVAAVGDAVIRQSDGSISWLDVGTAYYERIAQSIEEFESHLATPDFFDERLIPLLVEDLRKEGRFLGKGECYSYQVPPALGGELEPANLETCDFLIHFNVLGQIHEQIRDLPPGTRIEGIELR